MALRLLNKERKLVLLPHCVPLGHKSAAEVTPAASLSSLQLDQGRLQESLKTTLPSIIGSILWVSIRTRPDISWAVARASSLATKDPK
eukprot:5391512-Amphidinium_carterae.2